MDQFWFGYKVAIGIHNQPIVSAIAINFPRNSPQGVTPLHLYVMRFDRYKYGVWRRHTRAKPIVRHGFWQRIACGAETWNDIGTDAWRVKDLLFLLVQQQEHRNASQRGGQAES